MTLGDGQSITLAGVDAAALSDSDFVFDQTPVTNNAASIVISDGAMMPFSGIINNTGTIALESTGNTTELDLIQYGITLQGGGAAGVDQTFVLEGVDLATLGTQTEIISSLLAANRLLVDA